MGLGHAPMKVRSTQMGIEHIKETQTSATNPRKEDTQLMNTQLE